MKKRDRYKRKREKNKKRSLSKKIIICSVLAVVFLLGLYILFSTVPFSSKVSFIRTLSPKAAIIDQGSLAPTAGPNPDFVKEATAILKEAGFSLDYYPGEEVTVDFYRDLPTYGYDLIIQRTHSGMIYPPKDIPASEHNSYNFPKSGHLCLFTNERFDAIKAETKYLIDLTKFRLVKCYYNDEGKKRGETYFGLSPMFVTQGMRGEFEETIILMMGCEGLQHNKMAEAFIQKGCKAYISWNELISSYHTDQATIYLLQQLLLKKLSVKEAVIETRAEVGPDPIFNSILGFYPIEAGNYIL